MLLLYNIALFFYRLFIFIAALFGNKKAKQWIEGRKNIFQKIEDALSPITNHQSPITWIHCASLGEFEQGRPLIEKLKIGNEKLKIIVTFFSPSGYEVRKNYQGADYIFYLPLDTKKNAKKFINLIRPDMVFFVKYEFWYHYFTELHKRKIPVYLVSTIFRPEQIFFKEYGKLFRDLLKTVSHFFVQNKTSADLLKTIGITNVTISGDTRFDRVYDTCQNIKKSPVIEQFKQNKKILLAGSTWAEDEKIIYDLPLEKYGLKLILAPHEVHESHIQSIIQQFSSTLAPSQIIRYSQANENNVKEMQMLIIDNIGMLSSLYQYGEIAYIGGGFGKGIHNILEAATFEMPIFFGTNYHRFQEAKELIKLGSAFSINNADELKNKIEALCGNKHLLYELSQISKKYVEDNTGATSVIIEYLKKVQSFRKS